MSLKEIPLQQSYDSDEHDILNDFYIPVLNNSYRYRRLAGFFSSTSLAIAARGIQGLLKNEGEIKLIASAVLSKDDLDAINQGLETPEKVIEKMMIKDLDEITDEFIRDHIRALGWMIAKKKLEIKIAIVADNIDLQFCKEIVNQRGIFHQKVGIMEDSEGNCISFSGSDNETAAAWQNNIEEFKVFRNWIETERPYLESDIKRFNKFWRGDALRTKIIDVPTAVREKLIKYAPQDINDLELDRWMEKQKLKKKEKILRPYQKTAIVNWIDHNKKGIFEMATGTGKTLTALGSLKELLKEKVRLITVISCPSSHLINQWIEEIKEFGINHDIIIAASTNLNWRREIANYLLDIKNGISANLIILVTHDTFPSSDFIKIIEKSSVDIFLIVDEVHGIGAPERKKGLIDTLYKYRLGLSATPKRWYDLEGTEELFDFFGKTVFEMSLKDAITTINPNTGKTFLTKYEYKPYFVELTAEELSEYEKQTKKIIRMYNQTMDKEEKDRLYNLILNKRANIIKNASNKLTVFSEILDEIYPPKHCLIYCTPEQIQTIQNILNERNIIQHKFTMVEGTKPSDKFGGLSERTFLLKKFAQGDYPVLVAINCLDEGVDVPPAKTAIILASSGNPRQYIQRRGRVLRQYPGKEKAVIYDIIVKPSILDRITNPELKAIEKRIFFKEINRYEEFANIAINSLECLNKIHKNKEDIFK
jgi:superfamily II DNA or RNA helicase